MMSVQSDIELLSVGAIEYFMGEFEYDVERLLDVFNAHHIFEKIMLQVETLHQLPFEDTYRYVMDEIQNHRNSLIVYHGTAADFEEISLDRALGYRDFGKGFYTTILLRQARSRAIRQSRRAHRQTAYLKSFLFDEIDGLKVKRFPSANEEWLEFVKVCRSKGGCPHNYDVVIGLLADDADMQTVLRYITGVYTAKEAMDRPSEMQ